MPIPSPKPSFIFMGKYQHIYIHKIRYFTLSQNWSCRNENIDFRQQKNKKNLDGAAVLSFYHLLSSTKECDFHQET